MKDLNDNPIEGVSIAVVGEVVTNWNATIIGPVRKASSNTL